MTNRIQTGVVDYRNFTPMLCKSATVEQVENGEFNSESEKEGLVDEEWFAEEKFDGVRAYVVRKKLYNRRGKDITHLFPELQLFVSKVPKSVLLDGEIIAKSKVFEDMSGRMHMKDKLFINLSAKNNPCTFVIFDCSKVYGRSVDLTQFYTYSKTSFAAQFLQDVLGEATRWGDELNVVFAERYSPQEGLEKAKEEGWEGIVLKKSFSKYVCGRSDDWRKVKLFEEVQHSFSSYESHPKGITIESDDGRRVVVNGSQAKEVKKEIDDNGVVVAEIQHLPQRNSNAWRFPSFRGIVKTQCEVGK